MFVYCAVAHLADFLNPFDPLPGYGLAGPIE
jgi:hypothetical protein